MNKTVGETLFIQLKIAEIMGRVVMWNCSGGGGGG